MREEYDEAIIQLGIGQLFVKAKVNEENDVYDRDINGEGKEGDTESKEKKLAVAPWVTDEVKVLCRLIKEGAGRGAKHRSRNKKADEKCKNRKGKKKKDLKVFLDEVIDKKVEVKMADNTVPLSKAISSAVDVPFPAGWQQ